jgi:hypothetical protein
MAGASDAGTTRALSPQSPLDGVCVLVVATLAGGRGDITFAANLLHALDAAGARVSLAVSAQSGLDAGRCALDLLRAVAATASPEQAGNSSGGLVQRLLSLHTYNHQGGRVEALNIAATVTSQCGDETASSAPAAAFQTASWGVAAPPPSLVIQGPLALFASGADVPAELAGCGLSVAGCAGRPSHVLPLLTVREFGQAAFCARPSPSGLTLDVSAGLAEAELGVFTVPRGAAAAASTSHSAALPVCGGALGSCCTPQAAPYFVAYFRTARHGRCAGRMLASGLALSLQTLVGVHHGTPACLAGAMVIAAAPTALQATMEPVAPGVVRRVADLYAPIDDASLSQLLRGRVADLYAPIDDASLSQLLRGLSGHPAVLSVAVEAEQLPDTDASAVGCAGESSGLVATTAAGRVVAHVLVVTLRGADTAATSASGVAPPPPAPPLVIRVALHDVFALALPVPAFRALLAGAEAAVVTGDATLNEALAEGVPFWYSAEGHKARVAAALRCLATPPHLPAGRPGAEDATVAAAVRVVDAFWACVSADLRRHAPVAVSTDAGSGENEASSDATWPQLLEVVAAAVGPASAAQGHPSGGMDVVRWAFGLWAGSVMRRRGGLGDAVVRLAAGLVGAAVAAQTAAAVARPDTGSTTP